MIASSRVLVTGANGFVGRALVRRLVNDGHRVIAATRRKTDWHTAVTARHWSTYEGVGWKDEFANVDVVVHCAARTHILDRKTRSSDEPFHRINAVQTLAMAHGAAAAGVSRFIYLSSAHVHGNRTNDHPFRPSDPPQPESAYARSKLAAEQDLNRVALDTNLEVVIIRPPLIMGQNPKGNLGSLLTAVKRGVPLPFGSVTQNRRDLVSIETLADLVSRTVWHPAAPGAPLLVSDGRALSTRDVIAQLAALHGLVPRLIKVPVGLLRAVLALTGRDHLASQLLGNLEIDISDTRRRLNWHPPEGSIA